MFFSAVLSVHARNQSLGVIRQNARYVRRLSLPLWNIDNISATITKIWPCSNFLNCQVQMRLRTVDSRKEQQKRITRLELLQQEPRSPIPPTRIVHFRAKMSFFLKSEGIVYPVYFPPFATIDGKTRVIDVKDHVASIWKMPRERAHRAVLFYKREELKGLATSSIRDYEIAHRSNILLALPTAFGPPSFRQKSTGEDFSRPPLPKGDSIV